MMHQSFRQVSTQDYRGISLRKRHRGACFSSIRILSAFPRLHNVDLFNTEQVARWQEQSRWILFVCLACSISIFIKHSSSHLPCMWTEQSCSIWNVTVLKQGMQNLRTWNSRDSPHRTRPTEVQTRLNEDANESPATVVSFKSNKDQFIQHSVYISYKETQSLEKSKWILRRWREQQWYGLSEEEDFPTNKQARLEPQCAFSLLSLKRQIILAMASSDNMFWEVKRL